jgi:hypothetical protein
VAQCLNQLRHRVPHFTWRPIYIFDHMSLNLFLEWEIFRTKFLEKIKTHNFPSISFLRKIVPFVR